MQRSLVLEMLDLRVQGRKAKVAVSGPANGLPVMIVHGFGNTPRFANRRTLSAIAEAHASADPPVRFIAPVLPGFSGTPALKDTATFEQYAHWLAACLEALDVSGPVVLVGESMGGAIAMEFAVRYPDAVAALALFNSVGAFEAERSRLSWILGAGLGAGVRRKYVGQWIASVTDAVAVLRHPLNAWRLFGAIATADLTPCMAELRRRALPIVTVFGRNDPVIRHSSARVFAETLGVTPAFIAADHRSFIDGHEAIGLVVAEMVEAIAGKRPLNASAWSQYALVPENTAITSVATMGIARNDTPIVVGIHGCGLSKETMAPLGEHVAQWSQFLAPDLPGYGDSDKPPHVYDIDEHAGALAAWLDKNELTGVTLVGHSMGCQVAVALALLRPQLVNSCVLIAPIVSPRNRDIKRLLARTARDVTHEPVALYPVALNAYRKAGVRTLWRMCRYIVEDHIDQRIKHVSVPVAIVRGEEDRLTSQPWVEQLVACAPMGTLHLLPDAAHAVHWSEAGAVADLIKATALKGHAGTT